MTAPTHPFRVFSADLYRKPGVADALLFVQDRYGLNVNIILFCLWEADSGGGYLPVGSIATALRRITDWEEHVIKPLHEIRRACRDEALGVPEFLLQAFQPHIEAIELGAEHVEQLMLAESARPSAAAASRLAGDEEQNDAARDAVRSLKAYIDEVDIKNDAQLAECLSVILHAAFAGACFPAAG